MEQRPLRLGDIVDDYCPRERRVTNHAIVALVDETVKQTRCTTCDHEHVFKHAKEPRKRKKDETSALYSQVLSGLQPPASGMPATPVAAPAPAAPVALAEADIAVEPPAVAVAVVEPIAAAAAQAADPGDAEDPDDSIGNVASDNEPWSMHRRLIRAQLPRTGNEPPAARPLPDFTIRQPTSRGGQRPWGRGGGGGEANGNTPNRHGRGGGQGQGQGAGQARPGGRGRFSGPRPDGGRRGGPGQGGGGGRPGGGGGRGRRSR